MPHSTHENADAGKKLLLNQVPAGTASLDPPTELRILPAVDEVRGGPNRSFTGDRFRVTRMTFPTEARV